MKRLGLLMRVLLVVFVVWGVMLSVLPVRRTCRAVAYPYQIDFVEGFILKSAMDLADGRPIYRDYQEEPYLLCNYAPFYVALNALPFMLGAGPTFVFGRLLNVVAGLVILVLLVWAVYRRSKGVLVSLVGALVFLTSLELYVFIVLYRVDMLALALSFAGVAILVGGEKESERNYRAALLLFVLSFFTKQTEVVAPLACFVYLLTRDRRRAMWFGVEYVSIIVGLTLLFVLVTGGRYYENVIYANANKMYLILMWIFLKGFWVRSCFFLVAVLVCVVYYVFLRGRREGLRWKWESLDLSSFYLVASMLHFVALAKTGAFVNYLLEPMLAFGLFLGLRLGEMMKRVGEVRRVNVDFIAAVLVMLLLLGHAWRTSTLKRGVDWGPMPDARHDREAARGIFAEMERRGGAVVSEYPIFALRAGREVVFNPFCSILAAEGKWDEEEFFAGLKEGKYGLIISAHDFSEPLPYYLLYTEGIAGAVRENYEKVTEQGFSTVGRLYVFARRGRSGGKQ